MIIRLAVAGEETKVVELINDLIIELGGAPLPVEDAAKTTAAFVSGELEGAVIVADNKGDLVGACTLS